jgi:hypothetical protein
LKLLEISQTGGSIDRWVKKYSYQPASRRAKIHFTSPVDRFFSGPKYDVYSRALQSNPVRQNQHDKNSV